MRSDKTISQRKLHHFSVKVQDLIEAGKMLLEDDRSFPPFYRERIEKMVETTTQIFGALYSACSEGKTNFLDQRRQAR